MLPKDKRSSSSFDIPSKTNTDSVSSESRSASPVESEDRNRDDFIEYQQSALALFNNLIQNESFLLDLGFNPAMMSEIKSFANLCSEDILKKEAQAISERDEVTYANINASLFWRLSAFLTTTAPEIITFRRAIEVFEKEKLDSSNSLSLQYMSHVRGPHGLLDQKDFDKYVEIMDRFDKDIASIKSDIEDYVELSAETLSDHDEMRLQIILDDGAALLKKTASDVISVLKDDLDKIDEFLLYKRKSMDFDPKKLSQDTRFQAAEMLRHGYTEVIKEMGQVKTANDREKLASAVELLTGVFEFAMQKGKGLSNTYHLDVKPRGILSKVSKLLTQAPSFADIAQKLQSDRSMIERECNHVLAQTKPMKFTKR